MSGARSAASPRIRPAELSDLDALLQLEEAAFPGDRLDRRALRHAIGSPTIISLVATDADRLAGYVLVETRRRSRYGHLTSVAVSTGRGGRGIGAALVAAAEDGARRAGCTTLRLEVRTDNAPARRLYERLGYAHAGTEAEYYEDGTAAERYERALG